MGSTKEHEVEVHNLVELAGKSIGHVCDQDFFEKKKINDEDFDCSVIGALKQGVSIPNIKEIQSCYRL